MAHPGTVHKYSKKLIAFEHASPHASSTSSSTQSSDAPNTLLWIGGLGDGLLTVQYPSTIAASLPPTWRLAEVLLRSSYNGWATGSLMRDARELGECVKYFHELRPGRKVVLMGHSTGCQDIMEYLIGKGSDEREVIDGAILQGGVSDREAWDFMLESEQEKEELHQIVRTARDMIEGGEEKEIVKVAGKGKGNMVASALGAPMSAYRTYSLLAPGGDDDYFSTDLSDKHFGTTFGKIPASTSVCLLLGSEDPYVAKSVDKKELLGRWARIIKEGGGKVDERNGGVVEGAHHNLNGDPDEVVGDLVRRVIGFVDGLEGKEGSGARL